MIYDNLNDDELEILDEILDGRATISLHMLNPEVCAYGTYPKYLKWMAIYAPYLKSIDKHIVISSTKYYFKQAELDYYYPTNTSGNQIAPPFHILALDGNIELTYVNTSTGTKIYDYAKALCENETTNYKDHKALAVSLTQDSHHKVKIISCESKAWILSNNFTPDFIQQCNALIPYIFDIKELKEDENVMNVCKAVAKNEPIKEYFKEIFSNLEEIRNQQKVIIIKEALNARVTAQAKNVKSNIERYEANIRDYEERLSDYYNKLEELQAEHMGLLSKKGYEEEQVKELLDYVNRNRFIQNMTTKQFYSSYAGTSINMLFLNIISPISIYNPEPLERFISGNLDYYGKTTKGYILKAFKRIFIDEELQMICQTYLKLDLASADMNARSGDLNIDSTTYDRIPQPHLSRYNCWGDNTNLIKQDLREGKFCDALNNIVIATQNINFTDATVLSSFIEMLANSNRLITLKSCLSKADGNLWSIKDIIDQIKREEEAGNKNEEVGHPELHDTIPEANN